VDPAGSRPARVALLGAPPINRPVPSEGTPRSPRGRKKPDRRQTERIEEIYKGRLRAAAYARRLPPALIEANGDEERYPRRWGSFSKGLPHNALGEVDPRAYDTYLRAVDKGDHSVFEQIPLGGYLKLANPQAAYAFELIGPDATQLPYDLDSDLRLDRRAHTRPRMSAARSPRCKPERE
jgi:hypothetical protein